MWANRDLTTWLGLLGKVKGETVAAHAGKSRRMQGFQPRRFLAGPNGATENSQGLSAPGKATDTWHSQAPLADASGWCAPCRSQNRTLLTPMASPGGVGRGVATEPAEFEKRTRVAEDMLMP